MTRIEAKCDALAYGFRTGRLNLYVLGLNAQAAVESLSGTREVTRTYKVSLGNYAFGLVLVLLLIFAFAYALAEKNPDGIPPTPTRTTPPQPSLFQSSQPSQATSPGVPQNTTTAP